MIQQPPLHGRQHYHGGADEHRLDWEKVGASGPFFSEEAAIHGHIIRDGSAGNMTLVNGALNATTTLIQHNTIVYEVGVDCDVVSTPSRIIISTAGLYMILVRLTDLDSGSGDYGVAVGYGFDATTAIWSPTGVVRRVVAGLVLAYGITYQELAVNDYITQVAGQNSGSNKTFTYLAELVVVRIAGRMAAT